MVIRFDELNPYEVLDIEPDATLSEITKAFAKKNRGASQERKQARKAFDSLRDPGKRMIIDSFSPLFYKDEQGFRTIVQNLAVKGTGNNYIKPFNLTDSLEESLEKLNRAIIHELFSDVPTPKSAPQLASDFDDLGEFIDNWLK